MSELRFHWELELLSHNSTSVRIRITQPLLCTEMELVTRDKYSRLTTWLSVSLSEQSEAESGWKTDFLSGFFDIVWGLPCVFVCENNLCAKVEG